MFSHFRRTWERLRSPLNISVRQPQSRLPLWWSALLLVRRQMSRAWRVHKRGVIIGETNYVGFKNVKCFMASPVTTEKRNDWILPPWSLTFDFEPLIGVWHFRQCGATFSINRLGNKLGNKSRRYFMSEIWQIMTLFCIMPVHTGDQRSPLSDIARLTRQPALKSWGLILNWKSRNLEVFQKYTSWPGYDCASSSKKEVPWIGISWVSQLQLPWGKLPGSGQVFPE